jgi:hypothetical protein
MVSSAFSPLSHDLWFNDASAQSALLIHSDLPDPWLHLESVVIMNKELAGFGASLLEGTFFYDTYCTYYIYIYIQI